MKVELHRFAKKALSLFNKAATIKKTKDWISYGEKNDLPNEVLRVLATSGTAQLALNRLRKFILADGFKDEKIGKIEVNPKGETLSKVVKKLVYDVSYLRGFALRVVYTNDGKPGGIFHVPVKHIRKHPDGGFIYNPTFGENPFKKELSIYLEEHNSTEEPGAVKAYVREQISKTGEQWGKLIYYFEPAFHPYGETYPIPPFYSALEDIEADSALSRMEKNNLKRGFSADVIISTPEIDNEEEDENGRTQLDYFDRALNQFTGEEGSSILHLMANNEEEKPLIHVIDRAPIIDATEKASIRIPKKVCRMLEVPPVLCGFSEAGKLGDNQELLNQIELFSLTVYDLQAQIKEALEEAFKGSKYENSDFELSTLKIWRYIPKEVLQRLTADELRELFEIQLETSPEVGSQEVGFKPSTKEKEAENVS